MLRLCSALETFVGLNKLAPYSSRIFGACKERNFLKTHNLLSMVPQNSRAEDTAVTKKYRKEGVQK
jgi:hypothetical protein